ncbi:hypothetical protein GTH52_06905 [Clostridium tyrobutyricum]|nr:putative phage abortive infection protein [Clostridium tyrobutyricum]MBV4435379.1 putative phage abortive infection protein [Clostridium tyrobutyricum]QNB66635.1 hypothetical protein GTH52_06905 [Clostridium tyrobutyricum]
MKDKKMLLVELLVAILIIYFLLNPAKANIGDIATWIGSIGTVGTLIYALKQLEITKEESQEQNKNVNIQRFENTLFNLLSFNNDIINSIIYNDKKGREYFEIAYNQLKAFYKENKKNYTHIKDYIQELNSIRNVYEKFYKLNQRYIGHYFRNLYHIIKFIDRNNIINQNDKEYYASLVRAQLSTYEMLLIFYNSMNKYSEGKFLLLIRKYDLLQQLDETLLLDKTHKKIFDDFEKYDRK